MTLSDPSNDFDGGNLTVSGLKADDIVALRDQGNALGQVGVSGGLVSFGGVVIGSPLVISFAADATTAAVRVVIKTLTYANGTDVPRLQRRLSVNVPHAECVKLGVGPDSQRGFAVLTHSKARQPGFRTARRRWITTWTLI